MERCPLLSLSLELFLAICDELDLTNLKKLRLTCKALGYTLAAPVLRKLTISAKRVSLKETVRKLSCLTEAQCRTAQATRELVIYDLSSLTYGHLGLKGGPNVQKMYKGVLGENITQKEESDMRRRIHTAITSLKAVTTLTWHSDATDPTWLQVIIWRSIKELPNLRRLTIHALFSKCPLDLHALTELESITISGTPRTGLKPLFDNLAKLYASSPRLTSLEVQCYSRLAPGVGEVNTLHHLFHMCNNKSPPYRLRHLGLDSCFVRLDKVTLPHLRHLTSLNLGIAFNEPLLAPNVASSPDEIWRNFIGSGIHLEELRHDSITMSLIDYLSSYSGLKKLRLTFETWSDNRKHWAAADPFFNKCLVNHVDTLEELAIVAHYESPWNFCSNNSMSIAKCTKLKLLTMNIYLELGEETNSTQWELPDNNVVKLFIDIALANLPHTRHLILGAARRRNLPCLLPSRRYAARTDDIKKCVRKYIPPSSCQYLPPMTVFLPQSQGPTFIGARDACNGHRLIYTEKLPSLNSDSGGRSTSMATR